MDLSELSTPEDLYFVGADSLKDVKRTLFQVQKGTLPDRRPTQGTFTMDRVESMFSFRNPSPSL